jgi:hypothetical protein
MEIESWVGEHMSTFPSRAVAALYTIEAPIEI